MKKKLANLSESIQTDLCAMLDGMLENTGVTPKELDVIKTQACQVVIDNVKKI